MPGYFNKFEEELRYEANPRRMEGCEREIKRQRDSIERWQKEYKELLNSSFNKSELPSVSGAISRLEKDEMLRVGSMMGAVETGRMPEKEIVETLGAIKEAMGRFLGKGERKMNESKQKRLKDIHELLDTNYKRTRDDIKGLGGMGKTQTAVEHNKFSFYLLFL